MADYLSPPSVSANLMDDLNHRRFIKVIAGINNFDWNRVAPVIEAANQSTVSIIDMACNEALFKQARLLSKKPLMVSAVTARGLIEAARWGADALEVGNFDALYDGGYFISADDVALMAKEVLNNVPIHIPVSVTVPGHLSTSAQLNLAGYLDSIGVSMIQTEGASTVVGIDKKLKPISSEQKAARTIEHTRLLSKVVSCPIVTASGMDALTVRGALEAGASGIGLGSAVNKLSTIKAMVDELDAVHAQVTQLQITKTSVAV